VVVDRIKRPHIVVPILFEPCHDFVGRRRQVFFIMSASVAGTDSKPIAKKWQSADRDLAMLMRLSAQ
jgi:hypothetical protein